MHHDHKLNRKSLVLMEGFANFNDDDKCCDLSMKTRFIASAVLGIIGVVLSVISFFTFYTSIPTFVVIFTLGTICSVAGTFFSSGPRKQIEKLKEKEHLIATICLVLSFILVFIAAFAIKHVAACVVFVILEVVAYVFFYITLFPGGVKAIKAIVKTIFKC